MKTNHEVLDSVVSIWAVPVSQYMRDNFPDLPPFQYQVLTEHGNPFVNGSVKVCSANIQVEVPDGIDLLARAVATLEEAKDKAARDYREQVAQIDEQIKGLLQLEYIPEDEL